MIILDEKTIQQKIEELYKMNVYNGIINKEYYLCSSFRKEDMISIRISDEVFNIIRYIKDNLVVNISMIRFISILAKLGLARLYIIMKNNGVIDVYKNINEFKAYVDKRFHFILGSMFAIDSSNMFRGKKNVTKVYVDDIMKEMMDSLSPLFCGNSELLNVAIIFSMYELRNVSGLKIEDALDDIILYKVVIEEYFKFIRNTYEKVKDMDLKLRGDK